LLDESGTIRSATVRFQRSFDPRVRLLCARNAGLRGEPLHSSRWSLIYPPQVLTGLRPFHHLWTYLPVHAVLKGERPEKPLDAESLGFSPMLWELIQSCWSESSSDRPTARQLLDHLTPASTSWVPPVVYPAIGVDTFGVADSDSYGSSIISRCSSSRLLK